MDPLDDVPLEQVELNARTYNVLRRAGISTVDELMMLSHVELMAVRNFTRISYEHLRDQLISHHFMTREEPRGPFAGKG